MADRFLFYFFCARDVDDQPIIVKEFFARADIPQGLDENPAAAVFDRFAVGIAGMIDPARFVSANGGVDHFLVVIEPEIICLRIVLLLRNGGPQNAAAGVLDDFLALADGRCRKNTAAVDARLADFEKFGSAFFGKLPSATALAMSSLLLR